MRNWLLYIVFSSGFILVACNSNNSQTDISTKSNNKNFKNRVENTRNQRVTEGPVDSVGCKIVLLEMFNESLDEPQCEFFSVEICPGNDDTTTHSTTGGTITEFEGGNWSASVAASTRDFDILRNCFSINQKINIITEFTITLPCIYCDKKYNIGQFDFSDADGPARVLQNINTKAYTYLFKNGDLEVNNEYPLEILRRNNNEFQYVDLESNLITNSDYHYFCSIQKDSYVNDPYCYEIDKECIARVKVNIGELELSKSSTLMNLIGLDPIYKLVFIIVDEDHDEKFEEDISKLLENSSNCYLSNNDFTLENLEQIINQQCGHMADHINIVNIPICHSINLSNAQVSKFIVQDNL